MTSHPSSFRAWLVTICLLHSLNTSWAQAAKSIHPWLATDSIAQAQAYIVNLKDGDTIQTPVLVQFGLSSGWGLAPIAVKGSTKSGHHHLLINRDLPLDFKQPLPFNEQYIHFGKGQMETVLDLKPGAYTLRMLLADDKHLPHFVYSKPLRIKVTARNEVEAKTLLKSGVTLNIADGQTLKRPFVLRMHASGFTVAQRAQAIAGSGHFKLRISPKTGNIFELPFTNGQTEVNLQPPDGDYSATLMLMDNVQTDKVLAQTQAVNFRVAN